MLGPEGYIKDNSLRSPISARRSSIPRLSPSCNFAGTTALRLSTTTPYEHHQRSRRVFEVIETYHHNYPARCRRIQKKRLSARCPTLRCTRTRSSSSCPTGWYISRFVLVIRLFLSMTSVCCDDMLIDRCLTCPYSAGDLNHPTTSGHPSSYF